MKRDIFKVELGDDNKQRYLLNGVELLAHSFDLEESLVGGSALTLYYELDDFDFIQETQLDKCNREIEILEEQVRSLNEQNRTLKDALENLKLFGVKTYISIPTCVKESWESKFYPTYSPYLYSDTTNNNEHLY